MSTTALKIEKHEIPEAAISYKPKSPFEAKVLANEPLTESGSKEDIRNIILDIESSGITYLEGQSIGVVPPGLQENGKPHRVRLYSIASSRLGDTGKSLSVTLCVKRVLFEDENGETVRGVASNYLCDVKEGDTVNIIGPTGRTFFLPKDENVNLIMVAAGTGIAPFRAFIHHIYRDRKGWNGQVRLFFGARTGMESLYMNDANKDIGLYIQEETFKAYQAISRQNPEELPTTARKGYVQDQIRDNQQEIWSMIQEGNFSFYLCGMKNMYEGVHQVFRDLAAEEGKDWEEMQQQFKAEGRWNIEVY